MSVTVKQFLKAGFTFVVGDKWSSNQSSNHSISNPCMMGMLDHAMNNMEQIEDDWIVTGCAWRKGGDAQPLCGDSPVILSLTNGQFSNCAGNLNWPLKHGAIWKPDLVAIENSLNGDNLNINKNNNPTLTVVFTGSFTEINRSEARYIAGEHGLKCQCSVTKDLDLLVFGEASGSKLDKAKRMGIECITCSEFLSRYPHPEKETQHDYWDGKSDIKPGQVYLNDDSQLCEYVGICDFHFIGKLAEHPVPNYELDMCHFSLCKKVMTDAEKQERLTEELADNACEEAFGYSIQNCRPDVANTVRALIEAGYRKENDDDSCIPESRNIAS